MQYGDSVLSFPKDSIFTCKTRSVWRTRTRTSICKALEFTVQVSTFVELKLLRNRKVGNKVVVTHYLGYCGNNSTCPRAAPSYSDYYRP